MTRRYVKGITSHEHERYDQRQFQDGLLAVRRLLIEIENKCARDEILRDTTTVMLEGYRDELSAVARACDRSARGARGKGEANPPNEWDPEDPEPHRPG